MYSAHLVYRLEFIRDGKRVRNMDPANCWKKRKRIVHDSFRSVLELVPKLGYGTMNNDNTREDFLKTLKLRSDSCRLKFGLPLGKYSDNFIHGGREISAILLTDVGDGCCVVHVVLLISLEIM